MKNACTSNDGIWYIITLYSSPFQTYEKCRLHGDSEAKLENSPERNFSENTKNNDPTLWCIPVWYMYPHFCSSSLLFTLLLLYILDANARNWNSHSTVYALIRRPTHVRYSFLNSIARCSLFKINITWHKTYTVHSATLARANYLI